VCPEVISFIGYSGSGKTTLLTKVVGELKHRGYRVGVIKHHAHQQEVDVPGKDSWRYAEAGAATVCLASPRQVAVFHNTEQEYSLAELVSLLPPVDLILTEGFKRENTWQIEVFRPGAGRTPLGMQPRLLAVAAEETLYDGVLHFSLEDVAGIAGLLEQRVCRR